MMIILLLIPIAIFDNVNTWFTNLLGGTDKLLCALLTIMALDFITKAIAPIPQKRFKFIDCYHLIWKKIIVIFIVVISHIADILTNTNDTTRNATILYYIIVNAISFFKTAEKLEIVPGFLKELIEDLKNKLDKH